MDTLKINFILFLLIILSMELSSQSFEGSLDYEIKIDILGDSIFNGIDKKQLINNMKNEGLMPNENITYFYSKDGNYTSIFNLDQSSIISTYLASRKLLYTFYSNTNIVSATDVTIDLESKDGHAPKIALLKNKVKIGDYECSIVEVIWRTGIYRYYFNPDLLKIKPQLFKGYKYDQWYNYLLISKALPLMIEKEINNFYKVTYTLCKYSTEQFDHSIFEIPKMKEDKSLSHLNKRVFIIK